MSETLYMLHLRMSACVSMPVSACVCHDHLRRIRGATQINRCQYLQPLAAVAASCWYPPRMHAYGSSSNWWRSSSTVIVSRSSLCSSLHACARGSSSCCSSNSAGGVYVLACTPRLHASARTQHLPTATAVIVVGGGGEGEGEEQ